MQKGYKTVTKVKRKVFAYITNHQCLLVFSHPYHSDAGIQVPAGTVEKGEQIETAVLREAFEETGLTDLRLGSFLGEQERDMSDFGKDEIHHRFFYHLLAPGEPPSTWRHTELWSGEGEGPIVFEFFWAQLPHAVPFLIADHGIFLPRLLEELSLNTDLSQE